MQLNLSYDYFSRVAEANLFSEYRKNIYNCSTYMKR